MGAAGVVMSVLSPTSVRAQETKPYWERNNG